MENAASLVSVLIVNFNGRRHLRECLESVLSQTHPRIEVVLVDNASVDGSADFVAQAFPSVKLVRSDSNLGFTGGNNLGGRYCTGEFVYFLNNDTRADTDAVAALLRARAGHPDFSIFGSLLLDYADPSRVDSAGDTFYWMGPSFSFTNYPAALFNNPRPVTSAKGAAVLYPRELLDRLGWFDEDFFLLYEDVDLALRARHTGAKVLLVPQSRIHHKGSASLGGGKSALSFYYSERNHFLVALKNFPLPVLVRFLPGLLFTKIVRIYFAVKAGCFQAYLRGNIAIFRHIPSALAKRRVILSSSRLSSAEFSLLFRKKFFQERLAFRHGIYGIPT